jgi:peptidyl-prolyl cis-trans isomerase C
MAALANNERICHKAALPYFLIKPFTLRRIDLMMLARRALLPIYMLAATALMMSPVVSPAFAEDPADSTAAAAASPSAAPSPANIKTTPSKPRDYVIIKLGNDTIKNSEVVDTWNSLFPGGAAPDFNSFDETIRQNVLRGLVSERLVYQEALKAGYDKNAEVQKRLAALQKQVIMQAYMDEKAKELVTDDQLKKAYEEKVASAKGQEEIKARHILVGSEEEAKKVVSQLKKGTSFEKLAKDKSTDKGSGANGGELGWFTKEKMVPEFAEAAFELKKGEVSGPVKTPFGYHIIKVEDRRPITIVGFEDLKETLRAEVANQMVQKYLETMLQNANIKYYGPDGKQKAFSTSLTPTANAGSDDGAVN